MPKKSIMIAAKLTVEQLQNEKTLLHLKNKFLKLNKEEFEILLDPYDTEYADRRNPHILVSRRLYRFGVEPALFRSDTHYRNWCRELKEEYAAKEKGSIFSSILGLFSTIQRQRKIFPEDTKAAAAGHR